MNEDDIEIQPGGRAPTSRDPDEGGLTPVISPAVADDDERTDASAGSEDGEPGLGDPKVFDFSSDLNISVVKDDPQTAQAPNTDSRPHMAMKPPTIPQPIRKGPVNMLENGTPDLPGAVVGESHEWPFASAETLAKKDHVSFKAAAARMKPAAALRTMQTDAAEVRADGDRAIAGKADSGARGVPKPTERPAAAPRPSTIPPAATRDATMTRSVEDIEPLRIERLETQSSFDGTLPKRPFAEPPVPLRTAAPAPAPNLTPAPNLEPSPTPGEAADRAPINMRPAPRPAQAPDPSALASEAEIKNLRTYEGDIAEALAHRHSSRTSIAIAESKRRGEGETIRNSDAPPAAISTMRTPLTASSGTARSSHALSKLVIVLASIVLIGGGTIVGYYLYEKSPLVASQQPVAPTPRTVPALIPADEQAVITTDGLTSTQILAKIKSEFAKPQPAGTVKEIIPIEKRNGADYRVSAPEMAAVMGIPVPDIIDRTLTPQWMLGSYADANGAHPFVVVTTDLFQNAFAGMLAWEPSMPNDLKAFISPSDAASAAWSNEIVRNKDVRAFVSHEGRTLFLYSFIDNSTLVAAQDEAALNAVVTRVENKAFVR